MIVHCLWLHHCVLIHKLGPNSSNYGSVHAVLGFQGRLTQNTTWIIWSCYCPAYIVCVYLFVCLLCFFQNTTFTSKLKAKVITKHTSIWGLSIYFDRRHVARHAQRLFTNKANLLCGVIAQQYGGVDERFPSFNVLKLLYFSCSATTPPTKATYGNSIQINHWQFKSFKLLNYHKLILLPSSCTA